MSMNRNKLIFGGLIAVILLGLYVYATVIAILAAPCAGQPGCPTLNEGTVTILNLVGGLVSALVIAELAVTPAGEAPGERLLEADAHGKRAPSTALTVVKVVATVYILVWLLCGLASLIVGYLKYPNNVPELTATGKAWLGLAISSAYAYLGVKQG
jgi:hypothetical protein